ncbi:hypothetical protein [Pandoraea anhela]|uniref:hypothetical protein n=1 Tax=Pandoraea anhela TaxID=2508295 RepID=UPI00124162B0|nr:hypothetical protein [Pandoraea anhela]
MTFLSLQRHAWCVPIALSLWGAGAAPAIGAQSAAPPPDATDPASPDAPVGALPDGVLHDFARPALSVATGDWRAINASVSGAGHAGMGHAMSMPMSMPMTPASGATAPAMSGHEAMGHAMPMTPASGAAAPAMSGHEAMGHAMPMTPASGAAAPAMSGHEAMGHAMPMTPASGAADDPHAGHAMQGGVR